MDEWGEELDEARRRAVLAYAQALPQAILAGLEAPGGAGMLGGTRGGPVPWRLKEVIPEALKRAGGKERLRRGLVLAAWREVAGKDLARFTEAVALEEGVLVVHVPDPVVAHQLTYTRLALLRRYEERFPGAVREIRFQVGPSRRKGWRPPRPQTPAACGRRAARPWPWRKRPLRSSGSGWPGPPWPSSRGSGATPAPSARPRARPIPAPPAAATWKTPGCGGRRSGSCGARRRASGGRPRAARHLARENLLAQMRDLYPEALRSEEFRPLLADLARRYRNLFPQEPLPEGVRSLLKEG